IAIVKLSGGTALGYRRFKGDHRTMNAAPDILAIHADAKGAAPAVIVDDSGGARPSTTSFTDLNAMVNRLAHGLLARGVERGQRLVWCGPNSLEVLVTIHAARKLGL